MPYRCLIVLALFFSFSACSIHKIDIQQGNIVDDKQLEKLQLGMRREQVVNLLGTPLVQDPFRPDRWDYLYYLKPANKPAKRHQLTLFFEGDYLINFTADIPQRRPKQPDNKEAETEGKTIKTP
ncbi:MAG: cell envelope protein SmpA [Gammaproteobacteria bacterium]|nr:MAG: cell envelope protein SmpA [Gammaproteobacteria bacterium]